MLLGLVGALPVFIVSWVLRERREAMQRLCRRIVLLHGDFKASNLHWTQAGQLLVLDWARGDLRVATTGLRSWGTRRFRFACLRNPTRAKRNSGSWWFWTGLDPE
jgi:hypothetical protein